MRVAVAGKGGAGKTTVTATMARVAARSGRDVLCIDGDSNPNLAVALGMGDDPESTVLPPSLVSRRLDGGPALTSSLEDVLATHTATGPDGIRLSHMGMPGHAESGCMCSAHGVVRAMLADIGRDGATTFLDLEASPEHFSRGTARHVDVLLFVAEPYFRSLETVRRMADLARELAIPRIAVVANKIRDPDDADAVGDFCQRHDLTVLGQVPWDDAVLDADRERRPLIECTPDGAAVRALTTITTNVVAGTGATSPTSSGVQLGSSPGQ